MFGLLDRHLLALVIAHTTIFCSLLGALVLMR
jgi:hypothetical protein